ncbi:MAG: hypothetical protein EPN45_17185 [Rhizobiaceae bacterium]|nr:MAG: hypothetical protein EPN45_17185 [Rhizobiaceae bacterium]
MRKIDEIYLTLSLLWLVAGMVFGIWLGATEHFKFAESHAHMALVGFVVSAIFGMMYRFYPAMKQSGLAVWQLWVYQIGALVLVAGKIVVDAGGSPTLVIAGSFVILAGVVLMLYIFATRRAEAANPAASALPT